MVVVREEGYGSPGRSGFEHLRVRPAAQVVHRPTVAQQPAITVASLDEAGVARGNRGERRRPIQPGQVDLPMGEHERHQVQVGVGDAGHDQQALTQPPALRARADQRLQIAQAADPDHPVAGDGDARLPAEAMVAGERCHPAGDHKVRGGHVIHPPSRLRRFLQPGIDRTDSPECV